MENMDYTKMIEEDLVEAIKKQASLINDLKKKGVSKEQLEKDVNTLLRLKAESARRQESIRAQPKFDRASFEGLLTKRFFYTPSFKLYGG